MPFRPLFTEQLGDTYVQIVALSRELGANPFTANNTVVHQLPKPPFVGCELVGASVVSHIVGNDADGTLNVQIFKRQASDDARTALTAAFNVEVIVAREYTALTPASTTNAERQFLAADSCEVDLVSNSAAIDTQPTQLMFVLEYAILS